MKTSQIEILFAGPSNGTAILEVFNLSTAYSPVASVQEIQTSWEDQGVSWNSFLLFVAAAVLSLYQLWTILQAHSVKRQLMASGVVVPPHLWTWVPYFGRGLEMVMGNSPLDFMQRYSKQFDSPVFTAFVTGRHCAFFGDSRLLPLLSQSRNVPWDRNEPVIRALIAVGCQADEARQIHDQLHKKIHQYLLSKETVESLIIKAQHLLVREMDLEFPTSRIEWTRFELMDVVQRHVYAATTNVLVSEDLAGSEYLPYMRDLQRGFPHAYADIPLALLPTFRRAVDAYANRIKQPGFVENAADLTKFFFDGLEATENATIRGLIMIVFGSNTNSAPSIFWLIYYLLKDKTAYHAIQREVDQILGPSPDLSNPMTLDKIEELVGLRSAFREACRLQFGAFISRDLADDYILKPRIKDQGTGKNQKFFLPKGTRLMGWSETQHLDESIYENAREFRWDRFVPNEDGEAPRFFDRNGRRMSNPALEFGTGSHSCPGRRFIKSESAAYVAILLSRYDLRLVEEEKFRAAPGSEKESIGLGVNNPDRDVFFEIRPRMR